LIGIAGAILGGFLFEQFGHPGGTEDRPESPWS
jgi:hypothetical protein